MDESEHHDHHQELHTLEKLRINDRLIEVEKAIDRMVLVVENQKGNHELVLQNQASLLTRFDKLLFGTNGTPGLDKRLDRLEQTDKVRTWNLRVLWTTTVGVLVKTVVDTLTRHP